MEGSTLFEWADRLKALRDRKEALEAELRQVNVDIDNADWHLSNLMAESETQNFTRAGTMFCLTTKTRANAAPGRKEMCIRDSAKTMAIGITAEQWQQAAAGTYTGTMKKCIRDRIWTMPRCAGSGSALCGARGRTSRARRR